MDEAWLSGYSTQRTTKGTNPGAEWNSEVVCRKKSIKLTCMNGRDFIIRLDGRYAGNYAMFNGGMSALTDV